MKKILITLIFLWFFSSAHSWFNIETEITSPTIYNKVHWVHTLFLRQLQRIYNSNWTLNSTSYIRRSKVYRYDVVSPSCQWVKLFNMDNWASEITLWEWTNSNVNAKIKCIDLDSWCTQDYSNYLLVWHLSEPWTTFTDRAWNSNTCNWNLAGKKILIDKVLPKITLLSFWWTNFVNPWNSVWDWIEKIVWADDFKISFEDSVSVWSSYWISWIKKIDFNLYKTKDHKWNSLNDLVCNYLEEYTDYNIDWSILNADRKSISFNCEEQENWIKKIFKAWEYTINLDIYDFAWNVKSITRLINLYPDQISVSNSYLDLFSSDYNSKFWNNYDKYIYDIYLRDQYNNPIYEKELLLLDADCSDYTWCSNLETKLENWVDSLIEESNNFVTDLDWIVRFSLKSFAPWIFQEIFKVQTYIWNNSYDNLTSRVDTKYIWDFLKSNSFKKPVTWEISIENWEVPTLWKEQKYEIKLTNTWWLSSYTGWSLSVTTESIQNLTSGHFWNKFENVINYFWNNLNTTLSFSWLIDATDNVLEWISLETNNILIKYYLWWKEVNYYLDNFWINWCRVDTLWLKVIWNIQWDWKWEITWQDENFTDLSKTEVRTQIKENAYNLIKNRTSWTIVNWVKYVEWDSYVSWELSYETLIVKNWNIIISWDLNLSKSKLWIIVLKDNYNLEIDYNNTWNIYVLNNVEKINAIIYADWTLRSAKSNWDFYSDWELYNKLELEWSIFTRNTIWWAVAWESWKYLLPWWQETTNYDLAEIYDLNYVRKNNITCNPEEDYSFLIRYNSNIQLDPPKWFESN